MDNMKWIEGRQKTGYFKKKIIESKRFKFDCYLLKYPKDSEIPEHTDSAIWPFYEHHRLNIILVQPLGGIFHLEGKPKYGRIQKFRPDLQKHSVSKVLNGTRYVLSIGWCRKKTM